MGEILNFRKEAESREDLIWKCNCGNCSFIIYMNGELECALCDTMQSGCNAHDIAVKKWTRKEENYIEKNEE